ncbi:sensor histidine kinase [Terricaulis sp.]|uniref:sensor histidine kinase n=1 Tax=Terricaulis sp. TaxID=2768686 RepID=UPI003784652B
MSSPDAPKPAAGHGVVGRLRAFVDSLAGRLLVLTAAAVLVGEAAVFMPALANYHEAWLRERINLSQVAALALEVSPDLEIADQLEYELLTNAEVQRVAMQREGERVLLLEDPSASPEGPFITYDYTTGSPVQRFAWAVETMTAPEGRVLRVMAKPRFESGEFIEIILNEGPLKRAMFAFARRFIFYSMLILMAAGALVYGALTLAFVQPMRELTRSIERFRDKPEDVTVTFARTSRSDEIGRASNAAADMAEQVRAALRQKDRLAALGAAVARIGHDLRNMLSTAQLVADRLAKSDDPNVRALAPRLERTIGRAAGLAASTLKYGRADEEQPVLKPVDVAEVSAEAAADALIGFEDVTYRATIEAGLACVADAEHLHRVLVNLIRNGAQAMQGHARSDNNRSIVIRAARFGDRCEIDIIDHGPGVRENLREKLFEPFVSAAPEAGGTGLGLAIARELTRAMGGDLQLTRTGAEGATFQIILPAA